MQRLYSTFRASIALLYDLSLTLILILYRTVSSTAVYWQGFKSLIGAVFYVCLDCSPSDDISRFITVDGHEDNPELTNIVVRNFVCVKLLNLNTVDGLLVCRPRSLHLPASQITSTHSS